MTLSHPTPSLQSVFNTIIDQLTTLEREIRDGFGGLPRHSVSPIRQDESHRFLRQLHEVATEARPFREDHRHIDTLATRPVGWAIQLTFALANHRPSSLTTRQHRQVTAVARAFLKYERCLMLAEARNESALDALLTEIANAFSDTELLNKAA